MDRIIKDLFTGFMRIHILHHASKGEVYGAWMMEELRRHGYSVSPGTIYPVLNSLEKKGYLSSRRETVDGRVRKYYRTTKKGRKALDEAKEKIGEVNMEVFG
jgi:DNA-binding PadR family transcriptional regulator